MAASRRPLSATEIMDNLKALNGLSLDADVAAHMRVNPETVSRWKTRGNRVPEKELLQLAMLRGYSMDWLSFGEGAPYRREEGLDFSAEEKELIEKVKKSPAIRRALEKMLKIKPESLRVIVDLLEQMN